MRGNGSLPRSASGSAQQAGGGGGGGGGGGRRRTGGVHNHSSPGAGGRTDQQQQQQQRQQQPAEPAYARLDEGIAHGPAAEALQLPQPEANTQVVTSLLERLMATNPRAFDARAAIGLKVSDRSIMLDNPMGQRQAAAGGGQQRGSRWTGTLASRAQQRKLGLYQLQGLTYEAVQPLHRSWQQYIREVMSGAAAVGGGGDLEARLYGADLHGCLMRVAHTADRRYQGVRGIVVRETANTLQLVAPDSRLLTVPKQLCTWEFDADRRRVVTLLGPGLAQRSGAAGGGGGGGGKPKTLREAIRGQHRS
ncbi:ribonuclease P subunit p29 [Micractinium conductrix]|uniref:Ribonuclease P subunit p29 n=1 Tax=Micractinium conductrix TaxID=554055 RepID=A0A2P6VRT6_9CHLO|nr:ribonuclease P subunit p29 [Micractinium conductrix]|eukprot:PSC76792.1 ribonuclease P subunit p29 [Micractinium conductrix]